MQPMLGRAQVTTNFPEGSMAALFGVMEEKPRAPRSAPRPDRGEEDETGTDVVVGPGGREAVRRCLGFEKGRCIQTQNIPWDPFSSTSVSVYII